MKIFLCINLSVHNLLLASNNRAKTSKIRKKFSRQFEIKHLGAAKDFLGIPITQDRSSGSFLSSQLSFVDKILQCSQMAGAKPVSTPMNSATTDPSLSTSKSFTIITLHRSATGSLMYLLPRKRHGLKFAVGKLSQYCENLSTDHWAAMKSVYRYSCRTKNMTIQVRSSSLFTFTGYSDSDWASGSKSRKSTEGSVLKMTEGEIP